MVEIKTLVHMYLLFYGKSKLDDVIKQFRSHHRCRRDNRMQWLLFDTASSSFNVVLLVHIVASENRTHDQQHFMVYIKNIFFINLISSQAALSSVYFIKFFYPSKGFINF